LRVTIKFPDDSVMHCFEYALYSTPPQLEIFLHKCQLDVRPEFNAILCVSATLRLRVKPRTQRRKGAETQRLNETLDRLSCCICLGLVCLWSNWQLQKSQFMPVVSIFDETVEISKYNFHWQDATGNLIRRWDNAPHHPELDNYPHHVHAKDTVSASSEIGIRTVLSVVKSILNPRNQHTRIANSTN